MLRYYPITRSSHTHVTHLPADVTYSGRGLNYPYRIPPPRSVWIYTFCYRFGSLRFVAWFCTHCRSHIPHAPRCLTRTTGLRPLHRLVCYTHILPLFCVHLAFAHTGLSPFTRLGCRFAAFLRLRLYAFCIPGSDIHLPLPLPHVDAGLLPQFTPHCPHSHDPIHTYGCTVYLWLLQRFTHTHTFYRFIYAVAFGLRLVRTRSRTLRVLPGLLPAFLFLRFGWLPVTLVTCSYHTRPCYRTSSTAPVTRFPPQRLPTRPYICVRWFYLPHYAFATSLRLFPLILFAGYALHSWFVTHVPFTHTVVHVYTLVRWLVTFYTGCTVTVRTFAVWDAHTCRSGQVLPVARRSERTLHVVGTAFGCVTLRLYRLTPYTLIGPDITFPTPFPRTIWFFTPVRPLVGLVWLPHYRLVPRFYHSYHTFWTYPFPLYGCSATPFTI